MSYKFHAPNVAESDRDAIATPVDGMLIYNTDRDRFEFYEPFWGWHPVALTPSAMRDWGFEAIEEFSQQSSTNNWTQGVIVSGSIAQSSVFSVVKMSTGTNSAGGFRFVTNSSAFDFGSNLWRYDSRIRVNTNSDGIDTFQFLSGFFDQAGAVNQVDGAYFLYDSQGVSTGSAASGNWQIVTASNSVRTFTTTGTSIDNSNFQKLRIDVNADATRVNFYIDDSLVGTHNTNIPTGSSRLFGNGLILLKSAGTTARTVDVDFLYMKTKFTTPR